MNLLAAAFEYLVHVPNPDQVAAHSCVRHLTFP
jgi:hypothetical protein